MTTPAVAALPYGLRDVKLQAIDPAGVISATLVDLPIARTFMFSDVEEFEELRGDDRVQATHGNGPTVDWELEAGGISLEAYAVMAGGTVTTSGIGTATVKKYKKKATDVRPYFAVTGQAISDNGGDLHGVVYKAKADGSLEGAFEDGAFRLTSASGKGIADAADNLYDFLHHFTEAPIGAVTAAG